MVFSMKQAMPSPIRIMNGSDMLVVILASFPGHCSLTAVGHHAGVAFGHLAGVLAVDRRTLLSCDRHAAILAHVLSVFAFLSLAAFHVLSFVHHDRFPFGVFLCFR